MYRYIMMDSEYCSMGRWISAIVAYKTGMRLYEGKDLLTLYNGGWLDEAKLNALD